MAYSTTYPRDLMVAQGTDRGWSIERVGESWRDVSLALDRCGRPAVGHTFHYAGEGNRAEGRISELIDGVWRTQSFDQRFGADGIDLALSRDGRLAASYWPLLLAFPAPEPHAVICSVRAGDAWSTETADDRIARDMSDTSVDFGPTGQPILAYAGGEGVLVVEHDAGGWSRTRVDARGGVSGQSCCATQTSVSLAVDPEGAAHVAYGVVDHVGYATNRGGAWTTDDLAAFDYTYLQNEYPSLALDSQGGVHVVWYVFAGEIGSDLPAETGRYAVLARPNDGVDQNCDGIDGVDADGDGHASVETGGDDLDDHVPDT